MKKLFGLLVIVSTTTCGAASLFSVDDLLTGDERLSCEAILCLSSGERPGECQESLQRYFGIKYKKPSDTVRGRRNFLKICPESDSSPEMQSLVEALANGAGMCDVASLNMQFETYCKNEDCRGERTMAISNVLPSWCEDYYNHEFVDLGAYLPRYIGTPETGGRWVSAGEYDQMLSLYNETIRKQLEEQAIQDQYQVR